MKFLNSFKKFLDKYYIKLPKFPKGLNDFIVAVSPWLALVFGIMAIFAGIGAISALSSVMTFAAIAGVSGYAITTVLSALVLLVTGVFELMAFPGLRSRKARGWNLLFYSLLLNIVSSIVTLNTYSVLNTLLGALIGYYILYQVKSYYK